MPTSVLVYSESYRGKPVYGTLGARRWECEWYELTPAARERYKQPDYEHDHDRDEVCCVSVHKTKDAAIRAGRKAADGSVYGCAIVQEHVLEWFVEEDRVGDWEPCGPKFEVDANGDVAEI
jgi:hypothetical protein